LSIKPPFTDLQIQKAPSGFYKGYSMPVAVSSKALMTALVLWALIWPGNANRILSAWNGSILQTFNTFYVIAAGLFAFFLFALAIIPSVGGRKLGGVNTVPEFSNFSWFSMMFGAGLGVGLMVFATAEPLGLSASNPEILDGAVMPNTAEAVESAYRYTFLHYGLHA
jgi:choline-glycine betaine transporter